MRRKGNIQLTVALGFKPRFLVLRFSPIQLFSASLLAAVLIGGSGYLAALTSRSGDWRLHQEKIDDNVNLLAKSLQHVQVYEDSVKNRVNYLETVLADIIDLDKHLLTAPDALLKASDSTDDEYGIGGGDESEPFAVAAVQAESIGPARRVRGPFSYKGADVAQRLHRLNEGLKYVPMGSPVEGRVTSLYGSRKNPISGRLQKHHGIDIGVSSRVPVVTAADGVVKKASRKGGYGLTILIDHGNGMQTLYGHLSRIDVRVGETVCRGEQIGLIGSTGRSTGPHLHYEIRVDGVPQNPEPFIQIAGLLKLLS